MAGVRVFRGYQLGNPYPYPRATRDIYPRVSRTRGIPYWDIVFNICEGLGDIGREAQVPALLEGWGIPFTFSDSATLALCLDKAKTKVSGSMPITI